MASIPPLTLVPTVVKSSTLSVLFHVDSGAGQSMCSCSDAFLSVRPCAIEVIGVSGFLPILGIGSAMFVVVNVADTPVVLLVHDCLLSQGSSFNQLSVSQFQSSRTNTVDFSVGFPSLTLRSFTAHTIIPLRLEDGLYSFSAEPLSPNDGRYHSLPQLEMTPPPRPSHSVLM